MNKYAEMGPAGCKANIEHYRTLRDKYTELALEAHAEEMKWAHSLKMQTNPESALKELLTNN